MEHVERALWNALEQIQALEDEELDRVCDSPAFQAIVAYCTQRGGDGFTDAELGIPPE